MSDPIRQQGPGVEVGFGNWVVTGAVMDRANKGVIGDVDEIRDAHNAVRTKLYSNPGKKLTVEFEVDSGQSSILADLDDVVKGDAFTVNSIAFGVDDIKIDRTRKAVRVTVDLVKEDNVTYT